VTLDTLTRLALQALELAAIVAAPALLASAVVGLVVGVAQSASQIQEQALSFVLRLFAVGCALWLGADLIGTQLHAFTASVFEQLVVHGH